MKKYIMFLVKLLVAYGFSMAVYAILFSSAAAQAADNAELSVANAFLGLFGAASFLIFNLVLLVQFARDGILRREFQSAAKGETFAALDYARYALREVLICTAIYAIFQLPYCIFYSAFGYDHVHAIIVDKFFVMAAGFYTLCGGNGYLGLVISALLFFLIQLGARALILRHWNVNRLQRD